VLALQLSSSCFPRLAQEFRTYLEIRVVEY
jgi:hypothetical protein